MDLPEEAVPLVYPAGAGQASLFLSLARDLAKNAVLVTVAEEIFRSEKIHL
jgi:hypothetical protein